MIDISKLGKTHGQHGDKLKQKITASAGLGNATLMKNVRYLLRRLSEDEIVDAVMSI